MRNNHKCRLETSQKVIHILGNNIIFYAGLVYSQLWRGNSYPTYFFSQGRARSRHCTQNNSLHGRSEDPEASWDVRNIFLRSRRQLLTSPASSELKGVAIKRYFALKVREHFYRSNLNVIVEFDKNNLGFIRRAKKTINLKLEKTLYIRAISHCVKCLVICWKKKTRIKWLYFRLAYAPPFMNYTVAWVWLWQKVWRKEYYSTALLY